MKNAIAVLLGLTLLAAPSLHAVEVFRADFQNSAVQEHTTIANVNAGTALGTWSDLPDGVVMPTAAHGLHVREHVGTGNKALLIDRFATGNTGGNANFTETIARDGAVVDLKVCLFRTGATWESKRVFISGRDGNGNKSFEICLNTPNANTAGAEGQGLRIAYVDPVNGVTVVPQGAENELTGGGGAALQVADPTTFNGIRVTCGPTGYVIQHTPRTNEAGVQGWTSDVLPYNGAATEIAYIRFEGTAGTDNAVTSGYWVDDIVVEGTAAGAGAGALSWSFPLTGAQDNVPDSPFIGCGTLSLNAEQTTLTLHVEHNVTNPTAAHIHKGAAGVAGPVVFGLDHTQNPIVAEWNLTEADVTDLLDGLLYVNIHTAANPPGEIRGQFVDSSCDVALITSNVYPPFIDEGTTVILTAPEGSDYQWRKNNTDILGATNRVLVFDPVTVDDAGDYTVRYNDGTKVVLMTLPFKLLVLPEGSVPAAGLIGLVALAGACGLGGARLIKRSK